MQKTIAQILEEVRRVKTCSENQLRRYLKTLNIKPVGARQRPQRYPTTTTALILQHLGIEAVPLENREYKIPTMKQLRAERERSQKARGGK